VWAPGERCGDPLTEARCRGGIQIPGDPQLQRAVIAADDHLQAPPGTVVIMAVRPVVIMAVRHGRTPQRRHPARAVGNAIRWPPPYRQAHPYSGAEPAPADKAKGPIQPATKHDRGAI
jgi:hypothetical protein